MLKGCWTNFIEVTRLHPQMFVIRIGGHINGTQRDTYTISRNGSVILGAGYRERNTGSREGPLLLNVDGLILPGCICDLYAFYRSGLWLVWRLLYKWWIFNVGERIDRFEGRWRLSFCSDCHSRFGVFMENPLILRSSIQWFWLWFVISSFSVEYRLSITKLTNSFETIPNWHSLRVGVLTHKRVQMP